MPISRAKEGIFVVKLKVKDGSGKLQVLVTRSCARGIVAGNWSCSCIAGCYGKVGWSIWNNSNPARVVSSLEVVVGREAIAVWCF